MCTRRRVRDVLTILLPLMWWEYYAFDVLVNEIIRDVRV